MWTIVFPQSQQYLKRKKRFKYYDILTDDSHGSRVFQTAASDTKFLEVTAE